MLWEDVLVDLAFTLMYERAIQSSWDVVLRWERITLFVVRDEARGGIRVGGPWIRKKPQQEDLEKIMGQ